MSLEAWGDENPNSVPEGCVSEDEYDELKEKLREAVALLHRIVAESSFVAGPAVADAEKWLANNTVNGEIP